MNTTEQSLAERFRQGDEDAFRELYKQLGNAIFSFALRMTGSREDAEDVAVQTFTEAYRSRTRFEGQCSLSTWLYRIAVHMVHRQLRRRRPTSRLREEFLDQQSEAQMERIELVELVLFLPKNLRTAFLLVKLEGLTYEEAAQVLGKRPGTIQAQVHKASQRVRARLNPDHPKAFDLLAIEGKP